MIQERFNEIVDSELERVKELLVSKQTEYNLANADRLQHFKHAAGASGWPAQKCLFGYLLKHLLSIIDMLNSEEKFTKARWQEKMGDIHSYLILLLALLEDLNMFKDEEAK